MFFLTIFLIIENRKREERENERVFFRGSDSLLVLERRNRPEVERFLWYSSFGNGFTVWRLDTHWFEAILVLSRWLLLNCET